MAYTGNQLSIISGTIEGNFNVAVYYAGADTLATVLAANYITDGLARGLELGDIVYVVLGVLPANYVTIIMQVTGQQSAVPTNGANGVTLSAASQSAAIPQTKFTTAALVAGNVPAASITGAQDVVWQNTGATPGAQTLPSAATLFAAFPGAYVGMSYNLRIINTGAGTLTLTADAGATITLNGTMTVLQNTFRDFIVTFNSATTATIQTIGTGVAP
jgi:hypothetical protein